MENNRKMKRKFIKSLKKIFFIGLIWKSNANNNSFDL